MKKLLLILFLVLIPAFIFAQYELVYFDDPNEIEVVMQGAPFPFVELGLDLLCGDSIKTENSFAELQGYNAIIKIDENTFYRIDETGVNSTESTLLSGRIRARIQKLTGTFEIQTQTIALGVRGTDFILETNNGVDVVIVREGFVEVTKDNETIIVDEGEIVSSVTMVPREASAEEMNLFEQLQIQTVLESTIRLKIFSSQIDDLDSLEQEVNVFMTGDIDIIQIQHQSNSDIEIVYLWYREN